MPHILDSGALEALTPDDTGILREWTMKYAVITDPQTANALLSIYSSPSEIDEAEVVIPINGSEAQISQQPDFERCFTITTGKGLRIFLRAASVLERDSWVESIKRAQKPSTPPTRGASNSSSRGGIVQRGGSRRRCCGYVFLFDEASQIWVERFFYLSSGFLSEFVSVFRGPIAQHDLSHNCAIRVRGTPPCAEVKLGTGEILRFTGKNDVETTEWVLAIKTRAAEPPQPFSDMFRAAADASRFENDEGSLTFILRPDTSAECIAGYPSLFRLLGAHGDASAVVLEFVAHLTPEELPDTILASPELTPGSDGSNSLRMMYHKQGRYALHVRYRDRDIFGSPFKLTVHASLPSAPHSLVTGAGIVYAPTGNKTSKFIVRLRDRYLNLCEQVDANKLQIRLFGPAVVANVVQTEASAFEIAYKSTSTAQMIEIDVAYDGVPVAGAPFKPTYEEPSFDSTTAEEALTNEDGFSQQRRALLNPQQDEGVLEELRAAETTRQVAERAEAVSAFLSSKVRQDWASNSEDIDKVFHKDEQLELLMASSSLRATGTDEEPLSFRTLSVEVESSLGVKRLWEPEPLPPPWAPLSVVQAHVRHVRRDLQEAVQPLVDAVKAEVSTGRRLEPASTWKRILLDWEGADRTSRDQLESFKLAVLSSPLHHRDLIAAMCETVILAEDDLKSRRSIAGVQGGDVSMEALEEDEPERTRDSREDKNVDAKAELKARLQPKSAKEELRKRVQALALGRDLRGPIEPIALSAERTVRDKPVGETSRRFVHSDQEDEGEEEQGDADQPLVEDISEEEDLRLEYREEKETKESAHYQHSYELGERVLIDGAKHGTVRHIGTTKFAGGVWIGVELDEKLGRNAGSVDGVRYFSCPPLHGLFVRPDRVEPLTDSYSPDDEEYLGPLLGPGSLPHVDPRELVEALRVRQDDQGMVGRRDFVSGLRSLDQAIPDGAACALFDAFDVDGSGSLGASEFIPGCLVLCGGAGVDKLRMAFDLLDEDRSGALDRAELMRYASAVFRVVRHAHPEIFAGNGTDPVALAEESVQSAFDFCDRDSDGRLGFEEFKEWMVSMTGNGGVPPAAPPPARSDRRMTAATPQSASRQTQPQQLSALPTMSTPVKPTTLTTTRTPSKTPAQALAEWHEVERWVLDESGIVIPFEQRSTLEHLRNNGVTTLVRVARLTAADINHFNLSFDLRLRLVTQVRALAKKLVFEASERKIQLSPLAGS